MNGDDRADFSGWLEIELECCGDCLRAEAEIEFHGNQVIVVCPCGNHGPVRDSLHDAVTAWKKQNGRQLVEDAQAA